MKEPKPEIWKYFCPDCEVRATMIFPASFDGDCSLPCPGCEYLMEVVERPESREHVDDDNVINFTERRKMRMRLDALKKSPKKSPS